MGRQRRRNRAATPGYVSRIGPTCDAEGRPRGPVAEHGQRVARRRGGHRQLGRATQPNEASNSRRSYRRLPRLANWRTKSGPCRSPTQRGLWKRTNRTHLSYLIDSQFELSWGREIAAPLFSSYFSRL